MYLMVKRMQANSRGRNSRQTEVARFSAQGKTDLDSILLLGIPSHLVRRASSIIPDLTRVKALKEDGYRVVLVNSNPARS